MVPYWNPCAEADMRLPGRCCAVILAFLAPSLHAQTTTIDPEKPTTSFKTNVRVVLVDVTVTDKKGDPIAGLPKESFQLFEDDQLQTISSFEEHRGVEPTSAKLSPLPPGVFTNFPVIPPGDAVTILLIDGLNTPMQDQIHVCQQMLKYLNMIPPGARIAIFALTPELRMVQGFTSDTSVLLSALNDKKGVLYPHHSPVLGPSVESAMDTPPESYRAAELERRFEEDHKRRMDEAMTLAGLQQLGRYLGNFPGRKNVIWLSEYFPLSLLPDLKVRRNSGTSFFPVSAFTGPSDLGLSGSVPSFYGEIQRTSALLAAAQAAVYPVGAGLPGTMDELAKGTGGRAFHNRNGLADVVAYVSNVGTRYYRLSYKPANPRYSPLRRKILVKVADPKYILSYRRGYYLLDEKELPPKLEDQFSDPLMPLISFAAPDLSQIVYRLRVLPSQQQPAPDAPRAGVNSELKDPVVRYDIDFAVAVDDLMTHLEPNGDRSGSFEAKVVAYDSTGKPLNMAAQKLQLTLSPGDYVTAQKSGLQIHTELDVPSQTDVHLQTGIYDLNSGKAGTLGISMRMVSQKTKEKENKPQAENQAPQH